MAAKVRTLGEYLKELEKTKKGKPEQVSDALEVYLDLWRKAVERGIVKQSDEIEDALSKVEQSGGLYKAAER
ncbi:MAG: hypothetical protein JRM80_03575 [Nitrososphaerota archaeon]|nr:hypothetical protein [Nitrososphaerota archaeon]